MKNAINKSFACLQVAAVIAAGLISVLAVPGNDMDQQNRGIVRPGSWGGRGISLVVGKNSVTIELDCAKGTISSPLRLGKGGKFSGTGLLTRTGPGPIRLDVPLKPQAARFEGTVTGSRMRLKITLTGAVEVMNYILERDKQGRLVRCY